MPELQLFCDRLPASKVDFEASRFVVSTGVGLFVNGVHLLRGDLVPQGELSSYALRCEYEPPLRRIETVEYAKSNSSLCEACAERGVTLETIAQTPPDKVAWGGWSPSDDPEPKATLGEVVDLNLPQTTPQDLKTPPSDPNSQIPALSEEGAKERDKLMGLPYGGLLHRCRKQGLKTTGTKEDLRERLIAKLV